MSERRIPLVPVVAGDELVGVLTQEDIVRGLRLYQWLPTRAVHRVAHSW